MYATALIIYLIQYQNIVKKAISTVDCIQVSDDNNTYVLKGDSEIECLGDYHILVILIAGIPGFFLWGILVPIVISF